MARFYPAEYAAKQFNCLHAECGVFAAQSWDTLKRVRPGAGYRDTIIKSCKCNHCGRFSYWASEILIYPADSTAPPVHENTPEACKADYEEARCIANASPRGAAALLRLAVQKLMVELGEGGKNINGDIGSLVEKGLPIEIQQALDVCRVVGNNAVHPGEIDLKDTPETASALFDLFNVIIEDRIARVAKIKAAYVGLPKGIRDAIDKRDGNDVAAQALEPAQAAASADESKPKGEPDQ